MKNIVGTLFSIIILNISLNASSLIIQTNDSILVHVYEISDYLTQTEKYIRSYNITSKQNKITLNSKEVKQYILKKNNIRYSLFVEPNSSYKIILPQLSEDQVLEYLKTRQQPIKFTNSEKNINIKLIEIENLISLFYLENEDLIQFKKGIIRNYTYTEKDSVAIRQKKEPLSYYFNILKDSLYKEVNQNDSDFFKTSVKYIIASQEKKLFNKSNKYYYKTYIQNQTANLNNPFYVEFISNSIANYAFTSSFYKYESALEKNIVRKDYTGVDSIFALNDFLGNNELRTYIELITIKKYYELKYMKKELYVNWLELIANNNQENKISIICNNLLKEETSLLKGNKVDSITGLDQFNDSIIIPYNKKNKYYYIQFFSENCLDCATQIKSMKAIQKTYGKWVYFVSVYIGENDQEYLNIKKNNTFYWPFINVGNKSEQLINYFKIKSTSTYLLLNNDWEIEIYPANKPMDGNIMNTIYPAMEQIMLSNKKSNF